MKGALFTNDKGDNDSRPDMRGEVTIKGIKYSVSAWNNTSKAGKPYLGLKVSEWQERAPAEQPIAQSAAQHAGAGIGDDIPF